MSEPQPIEVVFARCFSGSDGARVLSHLRSLTLERALGPESDEALLRHLEGQRCPIQHIQGLIDRGHSPH